MNPAIPCLLLALAAPLPARDAGPQGGGEVLIAGVRYRFEPESLRASTAAVDGERALQVRGRLVPEAPSEALDFELVTLGTHRIYTLGLVRREGDHEKARWNATLKTRVEVEAPERPQAGDRATFTVQGPLVGAPGGPKGRPATWSGTFWAAFSVEQAP